MKKLLAIGAIVCALLCAAAIPGAAELRQGEIILIDEPETQAAGLTVPAGTLAWVDGGVHGQAVRLNGQTDYLEYTGEAVSSRSLSGAAWINWQGSATDDRSGEVGQRLWTLYRDEENYFSVCLRGYRDNIKVTENGTVYRVDGVYLEYVLSGVMGRRIEEFNPTAQDMDYAIPQNTWTHMAFTLNDRTMRLYIGGRLWFEHELENAATLLDASCLRIGGPLGDGPTLNALIDDAALFTKGLDADGVRALAQGAALDFTGASETTAYRPTKPTDPEPESEEDENALRIPTFAWIVVGAAAVAFVIAVVAVNRGGKEDAG
ncbi:MAG: LamG domain-containing protein [Clostridia bacterium]|nr:LamG domain-containing protein [Clostridia bacterium]